MHLNRLKMTVPPLTVLALFEEHAAAVYLQVKTLLDMNIKLREARDLLLPRLMSGEIMV